MTRGTTGVCVLAAQAGANVHVIDVGIDTAEPIPGLINMRVARGSGNIASAPAMSRRQAEKVTFGRHMLYAGAGKKRCHAVWCR